MKHLARMITGVSVLALWASSIAYAQGRVDNVRMSKQPDFDRIVLDLGIDPVTAEQNLSTDEFSLEMSATRPTLQLATEDKLNRMRVYFEDTDTGGSRLVVDRGGRNVRVFRLPGDAGRGKGDRLVVDIGRRGGSELAIPGDATRVPLGQARASRRSIPEPEPEPAGFVESTPAPVPAPSATPPSASRTPSGRTTVDPPPGEDVWVLVRAIEIEGVRDSPSLSDLQDLELPVSPVNGGFVAPRGDAPVQRIPLRSLTGDDSGRRLSGTVLQLIVETIAAAYARNDKLGTKVDIRRTDLDNLYSDNSDGRLVIRVREASQRSAAR